MSRDNEYYLDIMIMNSSSFSYSVQDDSIFIRNFKEHEKKRYKFDYNETLFITISHSDFLKKTR